VVWLPAGGQAAGTGAGRVGGAAVPTGWVDRRWHDSCSAISDVGGDDW